MKLGKATFLLLSTISSSVLDVDANYDCYGFMEECGGQKECINFTIEKISTPNECSGENCEFKICYELDWSSPNCQMTSYNFLSYSCEKPGDQCLDNGGFADATEETWAGEGYKECQIVKPGGTAEFLIADGCGCSKSADESVAVNHATGSSTATCQPRQASTNSCKASSPNGEECQWTIVAPSCGNGGGGGDPHIKKWNGNRFFYHGECDLVMLHNEEFANNTGMDIHIRTTIKEFYSYIEMVAIQIGDQILEVTHQAVVLNGQRVPDQNLPIQLAGYKVNPPVKDGRFRVYRVDLENGDFIDVKVYLFFLHVEVSGKKEDFENSVGLLGHYHTGVTYARDGETVIEDMDEFGSEWQVQPDEPKLFRWNRRPQLPQARCRLPSVKADERHLRGKNTKLEQAAKAACAHTNPNDFDFCVFDVMATGDLGMAGAW